MEEGSEPPAAVTQPLRRSLSSLMGELSSLMEELSSLMGGVTAATPRASQRASRPLVTATSNRH